MLRSQYIIKVMKKDLFKYLSSLCLVLVFLLGVTALCPQRVAGDGDDEIDYTQIGGKHNGELGVHPISQDEGYSSVLYNNLNGLPTSEANDIVQTYDGFIWIGSYAGLIRYDGSRFERMYVTDGLTNIKCLFVDTAGRLWAGSNDNGLILLDNGNITRWGLEDGLKSLSVRSIIEGSDGKMYVATTEGMVVVNEDMTLSYVADLRLRDAFLHELRIGADDRIYALSNSGDIYVLKDQRIDHFYRFSQSEFKGINCILPDPNDPDLVYVETQDGQVYHDSLDSGFVDSEPIDIAPLDQVEKFECIDGDIWICARNGAGVLNDQGFRELKNVKMKNSIGHVMTDYSGNLWFTSTREGVMKIVKNRFSDLFERYELSGRVVNTTCMYEDELFVGTDSGLVVIGEDGLADRVPLDQEAYVYGERRRTNDLIDLLHSSRIRSIIKDSKDRLWISTWRRYGLLCYDHGTLTSYTDRDGLAGNNLRIVYECKDGKILVAGNGGAAMIVDGEVHSIYSENDRVINTDVLTICEGENGDVILGTDGDGIFIINEDGMRHIDHSNGLSSGNVMRIKPDPENDVYWVITGNSLCYLDRDYELTNVDKFPYSNNFDLYKNSKNELWILSSNGIYVCKAEDVLSGERLDPIHFGMSDGLPYITTANSYSELTEDGDLYLAGNAGVAKVNIESEFENIDDLLFGVPYIEADGETIYPDERGYFTVPHDTNRIAVAGRVYTYSLTAPLISCRLDGFDEVNTVGYANEIFPIYYTNLPGGTYHFFMELHNSIYGNSVGTMVVINKEKAFYEQLWFYLYAGADFLLLLFAAFSRYADYREKKLEKKHREESEKQRINNELKLGSSIQQATLPHVFPPFPDRSEFELYASADPAKEVGGDFYDFFFIDEDHLCMLIADVSGKGIPGALFMMISKAILNNTAMFNKSPAKILTMANEAICANNQAKMFVTVWLGILEVSTGKMKAANAGHEYPILKKPGGNFEIIKDSHGLVIGAMDDFVYQEYDMDLEPGSKLFLYTDGIPEATDKDNKLFGMERLVKALNEKPDGHPQQLMSDVQKAVDRFVKDAEQFDDLTMMCFEYKGPKKEKAKKKK